MIEINKKKRKKKFEIKFLKKKMKKGKKIKKLKTKFWKKNWNIRKIQEK